VSVVIDIDTKIQKSPKEENCWLGVSELPHVATLATLADLIP
jgi:hypothetical protein